jgi:hypothetical protein
MGNKVYVDDLKQVLHDLKEDIESKGIVDINKKLVFKFIDKHFGELANA